MNTRTSLLVIVAVAVGALTACNWTVGDCYPREERSSGVGAGPGWDPVPVYSSSSSGDFGDAPPEGPQDGREHKIQCNKTDSEEESHSDNSERPTDSPERPIDSPCHGVGDTAGDGQTYVFCSDACSSKCPPAGVNGISPTIFNFVTTITDDGTGPGGGWQQASVRLKIKRWVDVLPEFWECPEMTFGMPLRNEFQGKISADMAARVSAQVATKATRDVMKSNLSIPQGIYCTKLKEEMDIRIKKIVFGAKVTQP